MMFDFMGWEEAAWLIEQGVERAIKRGKVTYDLARFRSDATEVSGSGASPISGRIIRSTPGLISSAW